MKKKNFLLFCLFFLFISASLLHSQVTITIDQPTSTSKWRGTQTIEWSVSNKTNEFRGIEPPDNPGYYRIFYAPSGTLIPDPSPEPSDPWVKINGDISDDGEENSSYSIDWDNMELNGNYILLIRAYNPDGECVEDAHVTFLIDNTPPEISIEYIPEEGERNAAGWYSSHNAPITVKITVTDTDAGVRSTNPLRYRIDNGTEINVPSGTTYTFTGTEGTAIEVWAYDEAKDKDEKANEKHEIYNDYKIDLTPPTISININYGARTFTLDVTDVTSGVFNTVYSFNGTDWPPYSGEPTPIPEGASQLTVHSIDIAGNIKEVTQSFSSNRKIIGYVKDYKGTALRNITVLLGGTENKTTTTDTSGYYEFIELDPFGHYFVSPLLKNNLPAARLYDGLDADKTDQNFVVNSGWLRGGYDRGNTRNYYFASSSVLTPMVITEKYSISNTGNNMLTGVLNTTDNKMDIVFTDGSALRSYYYTSSGYTRRWSPKTTAYNLTLLDGIQTETALDSMVLTGVGANIVELYNKNGAKTKEVIRPGAPSNIRWSVMSAGTGNLIFTGFDDGTGADTILFYNTLTDTTVWETSLNQKIIPGTEVLCLREAGKVGILVGSTSDTDDLKLIAIDIETGHSLWTKVFSGIRGKITPLVAPTEEGGWDDVIAVRTSTNDSSGAMQVYVLDGATGVMKKEWVAPSTPGTNTTFAAAIADMDNNETNELVISDGSGNIYVVNLSSGALITSSAGAGKVWAVVDFDGKADKKKEIIVSSGTEIKVLDSDLKVLASRDMEENILNVILGQTVGDGRIDIIISLPSKTSIVRAGATADLPGTPMIADIYSSGGTVYLIWTYTSLTGVDLSGFRIYRSSDGAVWKLIKTVAGDITSTTDSPSDGIYSYKVGAYNDYGEVLSNASEPVEVIGVEESSSVSSCFIATAAYGTPMAEEVVRLREFRDRHLIANPAGKAFVRWYYRHSPPVAGYIRQRGWARALVRVGLRPLLWLVSLIM